MLAGRQQVVTASMDFTAHRDLQTGKERHRLVGHPFFVNCASLIPGWQAYPHRALRTARILLWEARTGMPFRRGLWPRMLSHSRRTRQTLPPRPGWSYRKRRAWLYHIDKGPIQWFVGHAEEGEQKEWTRSGTVMTWRRGHGHADQTATLWHVRRARRGPDGGRTASVRAIAISRDGRQV